MKGNQGLRPELAEFVEAMEAKLEKNDYKPDWEDESLDYLITRLLEEEGELCHARDFGGDMADEAVDIANFCMMIYTKVRKDETT